MSLRHAILGFLSVQPFSGYDLKKAFDTSVRHFWSADKSAIYRMLADLEADGLVACERVAQETRPDRKEYTLTASGREEMGRWLTTPPAPAPRREPFLIRVFFSDGLDDAARDALFAEEIRQTEAGLDELRAVAAALAYDPELHLGPVLTLESGLRTGEAWLAWLREARGRPRGPEAARAVLAGMKSP